MLNGNCITFLKIDIHCIICYGLQILNVILKNIDYMENTKPKKMFW